MQVEEKKKKFGEFYTPIQVVNYILDCIGFTPDNNIEEKILIDPACGDGVFLAEAGKRLIKKFEKKGFDLTKPTDSRIVLETIINNVHGVDVNFDSCEKTKENLFSCVKELYEIVKKDYGSYSIKFKIFCFDSLLPNQLDNTKFDYVIGNPPYVRIHRIKPDSLKEEYRNLYESALGRFDTSVLFIERGIKWLKPFGALGYIVSNKFLTTNYGKGIRKFILNSSSIEQIVDLTDIEPFQVSVLPCILILKNKAESSRYFHYCIAKKIKKGFKTRMVDDLFKFIKVHINEYDFRDFIEAKINGNNETIMVQCFDAQIPSSDNVWFFIPSDELKVVDKIYNFKTHCLEELAEKINVGVKTTENAVFANYITEDFLKKLSLERELVHPCLRGTNIRRWRIRWSGKKERKDIYLLYPHEKQNNKVVPIDLDRYPNVKKYLESHKEELSSRYYIEESGRKWYEIWVHQDPEDFNAKLKIVGSDLSSHNNFMIDANGFFCLDSCYYIILKDKSEDCYNFILGLLNSKVLEFFHKRVASTHVYSDKYRYMTSYMRTYPIVFKPDSSTGKKIIGLVNEILRVVNENESKEIIDQLENRLDEEVYSLYQLDENERNVIEEALKVW